MKRCYHYRWALVPAASLPLVAVGILVSDLSFRTGPRDAAEGRRLSMDPLVAAPVALPSERRPLDGDRRSALGASAPAFERKYARWSRDDLAARREAVLEDLWEALESEASARFAAGRFDARRFEEQPFPRHATADGLVAVQRGTAGEYRKTLLSEEEYPEIHALLAEAEWIDTRLEVD